MLGIYSTSSQSVFLYLWICICVFVYLTVQNIIFDVVGPLVFQKYSIIRVYKVFWAWWRQTTNNRLNLVQVRSWNSEQSWLLQKLNVIVDLHQGEIYSWAVFLFWEIVCLMSWRFGLQLQRKGKFQMLYLVLKFTSFDAYCLSQGYNHFIHILFVWSYRSRGPSEPRLLAGL